jgi:hypothetical protein
MRVGCANESVEKYLIAMTFAYALRVGGDHLSVQKSIGPTGTTKVIENNMLDHRFSVAPMMDWTD